MSTNSRIQAYQQRAEQLKEDLTSLNQRYNVLSWSRLAFFLIAAGITFLLFRADIIAGFVGGMILLGMFLYLIKIHTQVADRREHQQRLQDINLQEILVLKGEWLSLNDGDEFRDYNHPYTYDLDFFGRGSVFQYINRTGTIIGRQRLAGDLQSPPQQVEEITLRQEAIREISEKPEWNLNFQALGMGELESSDDTASILTWLKEDSYYTGHKIYPRLLVILPALLFLSFALWLLTGISALEPLWGGFRLPGSVPVFFFLLNLAIVGINLGRTGRQQVQVGKKSGMLKKYAALLQQIETKEFRSGLLQKDKKSLLSGQEMASQVIESLGDLSYMLDQRLNIFMGMLLNGTLLWDILYVYKLEKWRFQHRDDLPNWFEVISRWDALVSLSRYAYNRPDFIFPVVEDGDFHVRAEQLGHPLLDPAVRVDNDFTLNKPGEFLIVTGANMAGKSTFMRTVGVNLILAMNGAPVCASTYSFVPIQMITSVRAHDSLSDNESYFYAELKQLKKIIDKLKEGKPVFIIVDEMLRGTNSRDKQVGSRKFIEQLIQLRGVGMVATHDLSLGTLAEEYPDYARNKRFEVEIRGEQLAFDYKLMDGISQNLNATFLMQKMGIMP